MKTTNSLRNEYRLISQQTGVKLPRAKYYCGKYSLPRWVRKLLSPRFNESCKIHDIHHVTEIVTHQEADRIFLENMKHQAGSNLYWKVMARVYYVAVCIYTYYKQNLRGS